MIEKFRLGREAIEYIKHELVKGHVFSKYLLNLDLPNGVVYTYMPPGINLKPSFDLGESIVYSFGVEVGYDFDQLLEETIIQYLDENQRRYAIFETHAMLGDPGIEKSQTKYFTLNSRKYCFICGSDSNKPVDECRRRASRYPLIISLFTIINETQNIYSTMSFTAEEFFCFNIRVDALVIGAFDGEGYVFWTRQDN